MLKPLMLLVCLIVFACILWAEMPDEQRKLMPPAELKLCRLTANSVQLSWNDVPYRSEAPYVVHRKTGDGAFAVLDLSYDNHYIDRDIAPDTQYQWRVSVKGYWVYSDSSEVVTLDKNQQNWAPSELQAEAIAINQISLRWQDNSFTESGFRLERKSAESDYQEIATIKPNTIAYTDSSIAQNTLYTYRLRAIADGSYSAYSNAQSCAVDSLSWAAKGFVYKFKRDFYHKKLALTFSWQNESRVAQSFILERKIDAGAFYPIATISATGIGAKELRQPVTELPWLGLLSTQYYSRWDGLEEYASDNFSYTDKDLKPNTVYRYRIRAAANGSYSSYSEELEWQLKPTDWSAGEIGISASSPRSVSLFWDWGIAGEKFYLYCKEDSSAYSLVDSVWTNTYLHRGLDPAKSYTYYVISRAADQWSAPTKAATWKLDPESWKPYEMIAEVTARNTIRLRWKDYCSFEEGVEIERKSSRGEYSLAGLTAKNEVEFTDIDLSYGANYTYRIRAFAENSYSAYSPELSIALVLAAPSKLSTVSVLPNAVSLVWVDDSLFETGFIIHRKEKDGDFAAIDKVASGILHYLDDRIEPDKEYTYMVMAYAGDIYSMFNPEANWVQKPSSFVLVPAGTLKLGETPTSFTEFYLDKYEVGQAEFQAVMGYNPSFFQRRENLPVETVSWFEAIEYCNRRSIMEGLSPCYSYGTFGTDPKQWPQNWKKVPQLSCDWQARGYRLPTEAEWQYAASDGSEHPNTTLLISKNPVVRSMNIDKYAWHANNSDLITHSRAKLKASQFGLYDMLGNVWEWVWDAYADSAVTQLENQPKQMLYGDKVIRGGSMSASREKCQMDFRDFMAAEKTKKNVGFRVCRNK